jgi:O-antigen ligase
MSHYIEFGVVLSIALPLGIHYAFFSLNGAQRIRRWLLVGLIASAIPFSISRSGVIAVAVAVAVLVAVWPWRLRFNMLAIVVGLVAAYRIVEPGLFGTIQSLFTDALDDPSVQSRTNDYAVAVDYINERPWFGRGAGTFIPDQYILLDNQLLNTLISTGIIGLAAFLALFLGGYWMLRSIRLRGADEETRHLAQALAASILVGLVSSTLFDSLSFTGFACVFFLLLGASGALWRLDATAGCRPVQVAAPVDKGRSANDPSRRHTYDHA